MAENGWHRIAREGIGEFSASASSAAQVAAYGKAFQMEVIAWSENLTVERANSMGVRRVDKQELFLRADFLTIHTVLSKRNPRLVGPEDLAAD